ncbi:VOC family protein [Tolypothrix campylonemoides VB511288]|nr:VOC family protein [Tolypothrix campylonemoides VB511288]
MHTALNVINVQKSVEFYQTIFDFSLVKISTF